jgi:hypothetical protein
LERPSFPASVFLFDVLGQFDLVHVAGLVAPRPLLVSDGSDGVRQPVSMAKMRETYDWCQGVYTSLDAVDHFTLMSVAGDAFPNPIVGWLNDKLRGST